MRKHKQIIYKRINGNLPFPPLKNHVWREVISDIPFTVNGKPLESKGAKSTSSLFSNVLSIPKSKEEQQVEEQQFRDAVDKGLIATGKSAEKILQDRIEIFFLKRKASRKGIRVRELTEKEQAFVTWIQDKKIVLKSLSGLIKDYELAFDDKIITVKISESGLKRYLKKYKPKKTGTR